MNKWEKALIEGMVERYDKVDTIHQIIDSNIARVLDEQSLETIHKYIMVKLEDKLNV